MASLRPDLLRLVCVNLTPRDPFVDMDKMTEEECISKIRAPNSEDFNFANLSLFLFTTSTKDWLAVLLFLIHNDISTTAYVQKIQGEGELVIKLVDELESPTPRMARSDILLMLDKLIGYGVLFTEIRDALLKLFSLIVDKNETKLMYPIMQRLESREDCELALPCFVATKNRMGACLALSRIQKKKNDKEENVISMGMFGEIPIPKKLPVDPVAFSFIQSSILQENDESEFIKYVSCFQNLERRLCIKDVLWILNAALSVGYARFAQVVWFEIVYKFCNWLRNSNRIPLEEEEKRELKAILCFVTKVPNERPMVDRDFFWNFKMGETARKHRCSVFHLTRKIGNKLEVWLTGDLLRKLKDFLEW